MNKTNSEYRAVYARSINLFSIVCLWNYTRKHNKKKNVAVEIDWGRRDSKIFSTDI